METTPLIAKPPRRSFWFWLRCCFWPLFARKRKLSPRVIKLGELPDEIYPPNTIRNQKYSLLSFLPLVLFEQFRFFMNLYFLIMALSQFIPDIRVGYLYTYWGPLCFVISVTLFREAYDDIARFRRDKAVNNQEYSRLIFEGPDRGQMETVTASSLRVGDIITLHRGLRAPADLLLLRTCDSTGSVFIATDQLDGETDWKVRFAVPSSHKCMSDSDVLNLNATVFAEKPQSDIHEFIGTWTGHDIAQMIELDIKHTIWSGCVLKSSFVTGMVLYTGSETRSVMNNFTPHSKVGKFDLRVNNLTKILFLMTFLLSLVMISLKGFNGKWYNYLCRFLLLFSYIIPISLRVNLEVGKSFYAWALKRDKKIEGSMMRSTTIPEELGRVSYLLTDKTGTLTCNQMIFKKLALDSLQYYEGNFHEVQALLTQHVTKEGTSMPPTPSESCTNVQDFVNVRLTDPSPLLSRSTSGGCVTGRQIYEIVLSMALCHNVTPVYEKESLDYAGTFVNNDADTTSSVMSESRGGAVPQQQLCDYQASSPDEVALVKWTDDMGVSLYQRDLWNISLKVRATNDIVHYTILHMFPFTSETKCMGIIVQDIESQHITYYLKGADVVLNSLVGSPEWLLRQSDSLAVEGLRTLVFAKKNLSMNEYKKFSDDYNDALGSLHGSSEKIKTCIDYLNKGLQLLTVTGVEDKLADQAANTIDMLTQAGIKIWMLTGDKPETALCIAKSLRLVSPCPSGVFVFAPVSSRVHTHAELQRLMAEGAGKALIIGGESLDCCLRWYYAELAGLVLESSAVVVARCSPTQKARVVALLQQYSAGKGVCAIGDGGNDVPMIQQADIGIGIEGKEGRSAALASDVSTKEFKSLSRLLLVHGRRSRLRSSTLSLFVIYRGLIISTIQAIFSTVFYLSSVSLYQGILMVGYGTIFTCFPVFSLLLDKDIRGQKALQDPALYKDIIKGRDFSYKMFFIWIGISVFQGGIVMYGALIMFEGEFIHIVSISFSALIFTELLMIALTIQTWHRFIVLANAFSLIVYICTLVIFHNYFDTEFIKTFDFMWKVVVITLVACLPLYIIKFTHQKIQSRTKITL